MGGGGPYTFTEDSCQRAIEMFCPHLWETLLLSIFFVVHLMNGEKSVEAIDLVIHRIEWGATIEMITGATSCQTSSSKLLTIYGSRVLTAVYLKVICFQFSR